MDAGSTDAIEWAMSVSQQGPQTSDAPMIWTERTHAGIAFRDDGDFDLADSLFGISEIEVALLSLLSFQITIVLKIIYNNSNLRLHNNSNIPTL